MTESNKGRFKCADEAQAVWDVFKKQLPNFWFVKMFEAGSDNAVLTLESFAKDLHEARLIHGSIYDEDGRIENKDVAHLVYILYKRFGFGMKAYQFDEFVHRMTLKGLLKGTIFYE